MSNIVLVLCIILIAFLVYVSTRPNTFTIKRRIVIKAKPEAIYPLLTDFHANGWGKWSPWEDMDPELKRTYTGAQDGVGAIYEWEGNNKVGAGRMEIQHADAPMSVDIRLDFMRPMKATNATEFRIIDEGNESMVTWCMHGPLSFVAKLFHMFMDMDKMVGADFERGLTKLKALAEAK
ncbi:SRPBCC family protein [Asticcacaulis solisilvae]|uniref:SRPBCC family protein n=1 Tax=Asticcacaulis solisilvae TaxID=1217274 RepID=UPI003FD6EC3A